MFRPFLLIAALLAPFPAFAKPVTVKVVVLTMFEVGEETGDVAGEFQHWAERYPFTEKVKVPGIEHPVRVSRAGVVLSTSRCSSVSPRSRARRG